MKHRSSRARHLVFIAAALVLATGPSLSAQTNPLASRDVALAIDSGAASNQEAAPGTVLAFHVHVEGAPWMRLFFADVELAGDPAAGTGSLLRITSLADGHRQELDAAGVAQWGRSSAYFNGDLLLVEVIAQPGTGANRVTLEKATVGWSPDPAPDSVGGSESICGSDDRVLSSDPRVARLLPGGCSGWLIDDACGCFITAGHCTSSTSIAQFNVPLSGPTGSLNHPGPSDQYAVDPASVQSNGGLGVGNDWAYLGFFANGTTGLTPVAAQGATFTLAAPPPFNPNQSIRITGYGIDSTPQTYNQVQQTNTGPWVTSSGNTLQYRADTEGGNSGSPVIHEPTGNAIGVHTHGGCNAVGGQNSGTASIHPGLQTALANPKGVCSKVTNAWQNLGGSLPGSGGIAPTLTGSGLLAAQQTVTLGLTGALANATGLMFFGFLPANIPFCGGTLGLVPFTWFPVPVDANGDYSLSFTPQNALPANLPFFVQVFVLDPGGVQGCSASNVVFTRAP